MECPNCFFVQPDKTPKCGKCGIVFDEWNKKHKAEEPKKTDLLTPLIFLLALAVVCLAGWWVMVPSCPAGRPVPPEAFQNVSCKFAFVPLPDWKSTGPSAECVNSDSVFGQLFAVSSAPVTAYEMISPVPIGQRSPQFFIRISPAESPVFAREDVDLHTAFFWKAIEHEPLVSWHKAESSELASIDGLPALKIRGVIRFVEQASDTRILATIVPGRARTYLLLWVGDVTFEDRMKEEIAFTLWSFRALGRPLNYDGLLSKWIDRAVARGWISERFRRTGRAYWGALSGMASREKG